MKVLCNTINRVVSDNKYYSHVEFDGRDYSYFTAEFNLSSYGWNKIVSDKRISVPFYIDRNTDLSRYRNIVGLTKILGRLKLLCERGVILESKGNILVYPVSSSKYLISVLYISTRFAY